MSAVDLTAEILALSVEDRIQLVTSIWDSIAEDAIPTTEEEERILEERLRHHEANPSEGTPWREVLERLRNRS